jgi:hypothetical protein
MKSSINLTVFSGVEWSGVERSDGASP